MNDFDLLNKIKQEYSVGEEYVRPYRNIYKKRLIKRQTRDNKEKININLIWNTIDVLIANYRSNGIKVKFVSRQGWQGQEEAENLNAVAEFDKTETNQQQIEYQAEQDSLFFGVGIVNSTGFDKTLKCPTRRVINPLAWIPDPLPTQTGQFDAKNYRFLWFMMLSNVYDMIDNYWEEKMNKFFQMQYDSWEDDLRRIYANKSWLWAITTNTIKDNFTADIYTHYTIIDGTKWKVVCDAKFSFIFHKEELKPILKEEKINPLLVPRPISLNYTEPERNNPFGRSLSDKLEDKQNAISILANLNMITAKREALWGDFLVNSRLIKNKEAFMKKSVWPRYWFVDENISKEESLANAMYEVPRGQIHQDTFTMMNYISAEANRDSKIDTMQQGLVPDKTMTKAEAQQIQSNANNLVSLKNSVKSWFYRDFYHQWRRSYLVNFDDAETKFALISADFERKGSQLKKDQFITSQMPYVKIGTAEDIMAVNESLKHHINQIYPIIVNDPEIHQTNKNIFIRLFHRVNGMKSNEINSILNYSVQEDKAKDYVMMVNMGHEPKSIFLDPNADLYTYWLYMQKAEDWEIKEKLLSLLSKAVSDLWLENQWTMMNSMQGMDKEWIFDNEVANSAASIMMSQNVSPDAVVARPNANSPLYS